MLELKNKIDLKNRGPEEASLLCGTNCLSASGDKRATRGMYIKNWRAARHKL